MKQQFEVVFVFFLFVLSFYVQLLQIDVQIEYEGDDFDLFSSLSFLSSALVAESAMVVQQ